jgi:phosphatidate cytidylyltransferase
LSNPGDAAGGTPLAQAAGEFDWPARALFGVLLATVAVSATLAGGFYFAAFVVLVASAAAREWHRMVSGRRYALEILATTCAIAASLVSVVAVRHGLWPLCFLACGALLAGTAAYANGANVLWNGFGAIYVGIPALSLVFLRGEGANGTASVLVVFIAIWASDTGALVLGRLIGGPKLAPALSPNKTWAGFLGGSCLAAAALALCAMLWSGNAWKAILLGLSLALAGHIGDLFESWMKRRAGRKNSGGLIPGHGGVLDRIDSILFAAPLAAGLVFVFGLDLLFGAHW